VADDDLDERAAKAWRDDHRRGFPACDRIVELLSSRFSITEWTLEAAPSDGPLVVRTLVARDLQSVRCELFRGEQVVHCAVERVSTSRRMAELRERLERDDEPLAGRERVDFGLVHACFHAVGWDGLEIDEQVARWFALRDVERWAQRALAE
jgi:hypothetical protein